MEKYFILIAGSPATGKSYLIQEIKKVIPDIFCITPDEGKEIFADSFGFRCREEKEELEKKVWDFYYKVLAIYMEIGKRVIVSEYPFSDKQKNKLENYAMLYRYQVITIRLVADFEILWRRRHERDIYSQGHLCHIMNHYQLGDKLKDRKKADGLISKKEFRKKTKERRYHEFALGALFEFDVSDYNKLDYQPLILDLKKRMDDNETF